MSLVDRVRVIRLLYNYRWFLQASSQQIRLRRIVGVMMSQDDSINDCAAIEATPTGDFMLRRAQFNVVIPLSNHQSVTTVTRHMAPPSSIASVTSQVERSFHK